MHPRSALGVLRITLSALSLALICSIDLPGQTPVLLKDINPRLAPNPSSNPGSFAKLGGVTFFAAETAKQGRELWRTDGTASGTSLVSDIVPGPSGSSPDQLTGIGSTLFFVAWDEQHGRELWRSDGTAKGTSLLRDILPGPADSGIGQLTQVAGTLYFTADDGVFGPELWRSDGVATGMVRDIARGPAGSSPVELTAFRGALCFSANDGVSGTELWKSDGSTSGTSMVLDIAPGKPGSDPTTLTAGAPALIFSVQIGARAELWRSDGTAKGTSLVVGLGSQPLSMTPFGQHVFFGDSDSRTSQSSLRKTDGTKLGTVTISPPFRWISELQVSGKSLFFSAWTSQGGDLWKTDGTTSGTVPVKQVPAFGLTPAGNSLFFWSGYTRTRIELWRSDGTRSGTLLLKRFQQPQMEGSWLFDSGKNLLFTADDGATGKELWMSAGTPQTTLLVKDIHPLGVTLDSDPLVIGELDGTALLSANDGSTGAELWRTDGSAAGTVLVRDIRLGPPGSDPWGLGALGREMILSAEDGVHGRELWKSDGTRSGTTLVKDIRPGPMSSAIRNPRIVGGVLYFAADDGTTGTELWRTDGTPAGTKLVADIIPTGSSSPYHLTGFRDRLFFSVQRGLGYHLYRSDGTAQGTVRVSKLWLEYPNTRRFAGYLQPFGIYRGELYFSARDAKTGYELWKTDGTDAGTVLVKDIRQGPGSSSPWDWLVVDDILYFRADDGIHGSELWRSDGTSSGTTLVADVRKGPASAYPRPLRDMNGALLFGANTISGSLELWQSRGTGATTSLLTRNWGGCRDKLPGGSRRGYFAGPVASGERPEWGLWETDGTPSGTRALFQQRPWRRGFSPSSLTLTRGKLLFSASDPVAGRELWVLDPGATAQRAGVACGAVAKRPTLDASDPVLGRTMQISGRQAPASALSLLLVGARAAPPVRFSGTCHAYVDPASLATLHAFVATQAAWKLPLRLPPGKSLVGAHLALQSWFLHPTQGIALSNAVYLTLGF